MTRWLLRTFTALSLMLSISSTARRFAPPSPPDSMALVRMTPSARDRFPRAGTMCFAVDLPASQPGYLTPPQFPAMRGKMSIPVPEGDRAGIRWNLDIRWETDDDNPAHPWVWKGRRAIVMPWWYPAVAGLLLPALYLGPWRGPWLRSRRVRQNQCPNCGYDLRATPDRCPECGATFSPAN